jgi:D-alanyl-D-alanine carboxypeptidase/D-alanyl-D-alanine-endopeptidase (penicillin-binding protein 4)
VLQHPVRRATTATLTALACLLPAAPATAADLDDTRAALAGQMRLAGGASGAAVRDLETGETLYALRDDAPRVPASVQKLFVTSAALLGLGAGHTFDTTVRAAAPVTDGVLAGDLFLVGGGDPGLHPDDLRALAAQVAAQGVLRVDGRVRGDASAWDALVGGPRAGWGYDRWIGGQLGALTLDRGWSAGRLQRRPARTAAARFSAELERAGVEVVGRAATGTAPPEAPELARVPSPPLRDLVRATNTPSDNFLAEMLLKGLGSTLGAGGSTAAGAAVVRATLDDLGIRPRIADGSGLSAANRTTPRQVVRLLERMDGQPAAARAFEESLAVAGRTGTLKRRMRGTAAAGACRAKTGTLRFTSALAGVCTTRAGGRVAFAFLMNGVSPVAARRLQDRMAAVLARYDGAVAPAVPAPDPPSSPASTSASASLSASPSSGSSSPASSASSPASSSTRTPSRSAFSSLEPGDSPATR